MEDCYLYRKQLSNSLKSSDLSFLDFKTFLLNDILYKVDIASMANSLELRVPFLDHRLVEFMFSIPFDKLYRNKELKYLLKKIAKKYLPEENIYRKKKGFSAPVTEWIEKNIRKEIINGVLIRKGILNREKIDKFLYNEKNMGKIWQLYIFEKWYLENIK